MKLTTFPRSVAIPTKMRSVQVWPAPHSAAELRAFLALCSYYSKFIRKFARHSVLLHALSEKKMKMQPSNGLSVKMHSHT